MRNKKVMALMLVLCMVLSFTVMAKENDREKTAVNDYIDSVIPQMLQMDDFKGKIVTLSDPVRIQNHPEEKMQLVLVGINGHFVGTLAISELDGELTSSFVHLEDEEAQKVLFEREPFSVCYQDGAVFLLTNESVSFLRGKKDSEGCPSTTGIVKKVAETRSFNLEKSAENLRSWEYYALSCSLVTTSDKTKTWAGCLASCYNYTHNTSVSTDGMISIIKGNSNFSPFCSDYWIEVGYSRIGWSSCTHGVGSGATYELFYDTIIDEHHPVLLQFHFANPAVDMVILAYEGFLRNIYRCGRLCCGR